MGEVLLADGVILIVPLFLGETALLIPVTIAAVAFAFDEVGLDGLGAVFPPFADDAMEATLLEGVFALGLTVRVLGEGGAAEGLGLMQVEIVFPDQVVIGYHLRAWAEPKSGEEAG